MRRLLTGDTVASNIINSLASNIRSRKDSYNKEAGGGDATDGNIWLANSFMSYLLETNRPTKPTIVQQFKRNLKAAADKAIEHLNGDAYPVGWLANVATSIIWTFVK